MTSDREIKDRLARARQEQRFYGPHSALTDLDWLVGEVERLRGLLARLEWASRDSDGLLGECPVCDGNPQRGHEPGCEWVAVMRERS